MEATNEPMAVESEAEIKDLCPGTQPIFLHTLAPANVDYSKAVAVMFDSFESISPRPLLQVVQAYGAPS